MTRTAGVSFSADHTAVDHLTDLVSAGKVTLLFGAHDIERSGPCSSAARMLAGSPRDRQCSATGR